MEENWMKTLSRQQAIDKINHLSSIAAPFLFIADFKGQKNHVLEIGELDTDQVLFEINGYSNHKLFKEFSRLQLSKRPVPYQVYQTYFEKIQHELTLGNTYLLNLTFPTRIKCDLSLKEIFEGSQARYKLLFKDQFVVFSPEIFVQIENGHLSSFPMKGTIDADLPNAKETILSSEKEMAEHATIVDLIRNDMSVYANHVTVEDFRYVDEVRTSDKHLLQVSSKIIGKLKEGYEERLGEIIYSLLPAGSICGAPKSKTLEIIDQVEQYDRNYYTGVFGYFDGQKLDSGVMIRYIEKEGSELIYKSGGGIHFLSDPQAEYQEMVDKVYVPVR